MVYHWIKKILIASLDIIAISAIGILSLLCRFDFVFSQIPREFIVSYTTYLPIQLTISIIIFIVYRMYSYVWRSVNLKDAAHMFMGVLTAFVINLVVKWFAGFTQSRSVEFISLICQLFVLIGMRCVLKIHSQFLGNLGKSQKNTRQRIMLIGAGRAGNMLLDEISTAEKLNGRVYCIIDDNASVWGRYLGGVRIIGGRDKIIESAKKYNITDIIFAIPSADPKNKKEILEICQKTGCKVKTLPGIYQIVNGETSLSDVKNIEIEDLLGREPVQLDNRNLLDFIENRTVLVTGAGGSIGSELCRQIAAYHPKKLIILDIYENNAYDLQQELRTKYAGKLDFSVEIASVRDKDKIYELFETYRPELVFHAAAHKHVPLMENCPSEAIKNNIFGTYHVVRAAEKFGVRKFVMISTDKAVNPTNIMGATKRFCEMILQSRQKSATEFCAVRFGNVLGSNGSVVPLFKRQIAEGGPVTITDKRITRFFMTIPEAVQLVLQAGAMAHKNQIYVLDMGQPVKILDLAENLIRLSGLEPYKDIEIKEIGLRPGEKLYEELLMKNEHLTKTENSKIFIEEQGDIDPRDTMNALIRLDDALSNRLSDDELIALMKKLVPTYHSPEQVNNKISS